MKYMPRCHFGTFPIFTKTSYREISRILETARFAWGLEMIVSVWTLTGISAARPVKFQRNWAPSNKNSGASSLHEILRYSIFSRVIGIRPDPMSFHQAIMGDLCYAKESFRVPSLIRLINYTWRFLNIIDLIDRIKIWSAMVILTPSMRWFHHSAHIKSIAWLLMPWLLVSPGHQ